MSLSPNLLDQDLTLLSEWFYPMSARNFLDGYWAKQFLHVSGTKDKFAGLFSWSELNRVLEHFASEPPRLRLNKNGKEVDSSLYLTTSRLGGRVGVCRLNADRLICELRDGATLNFNCVDEICPALGEVCEKLENIFKVSIVAHVYAAFGREDGFPLHWDEQDNLIIQVNGRKRWTIFEPTKTNPLASDPDLPPMPTNEPVWDGILCSGDLMHIPRGWWHITHAIDEPSLHITITVRSLTGNDFLQWVLKRLKKSADVRTNLPLLNSDCDRLDYLEALKKEIMRQCDSDILDRFISLQETQLRPRPQLGLPASVSCLKEMSANAAAPPQVENVRGLSKAVDSTLSGSD